MIINFKINNETSSLELSNVKRVILDETVKSSLLKNDKFHLIKWLINIAIRTLDDKELKEIKKQLKSSTQGTYHKLSDFHPNNFVKESFNEYKNTLINKLKPIFKKAGINLKNLPEDNFKVFFLKILKLLNEKVNRASAVLTSYATLPRINKEEKTKLGLTPFAYQFDHEPLKELIFKSGWRKWHSVFLFKTKNLEVLIELIDKKPLKVNFRSAWLTIYDSIIKKETFKGMITQEELTGKLRSYLMINELIKAINKAEELKITNVNDLSKVKPYLKDYKILGFHEKFNGLFLLKKTVKLKKKGTTRILFLNDKVNVLFINKNEKIVSVETYEKAPKGDFELTLAKESVEKLSKRDDWFNSKGKIILKTKENILKTKKDIIKTESKTFVFSKKNCELLKDNEFIITFITNSNGKIIIRDPINGTDFYKDNGELKLIQDFKQSFTKLLDYNDKYFLIGESIFKV